MDFKQRWSAASPTRAPISWTVIACLVMCAGLHVEANDTVPSTGILSTESPQASSFDTSSKAPRSDVPSKESTVNIAVTVSTTEHYTASQSSTTLLSTSFTKHTTLPTQTSKNAATDTMSQTVSSVSAASPTTKTEQPTSAESPTTNTEQPTSAESPTTKTGQPVSAEAPITKPEEPTSAESPATKTEQPTSAESPATNSSLSSSTVPSSATAANKTEASTEHSGNTTNAGSTTADINSTNVNTGSPLPASSQSSEKPDGPSTTGVENTATSATNLDSQKSAVVEPPATKPPSTVGTPISTEEQRALSPGSVAAITIIVIALVLVIFGGVAFWKIRSSSYGRLLEDQDYGSLGNYNNPLYDDS